jgi:tRNA nucleotidyltransferase (CCA-adding enzyme)
MKPSDQRIEIRFPSAEVEAACLTVCRLSRDSGGRALLVGGCARDAVRGATVRDLDIEVFGIAPEALEGALSRQLHLHQVGRAFEVLKLSGLPIDVSVPRREGEWDPEARPEEAAARRDFTLNSMAFDPLTGALIDPFDGLQDLIRGVLRHTSDRFGDDPLRVLRAMQLVARFELTVAPETLAECQRLRGASLVRERVFEEWRKLITQGVRPSLGLAFLRECGWVADLPELEALIGCPQDPEWHPEGDVWIHTLYCMDAFAAERVGEAREDLIVGLAVLCHDLGKPSTTERKGGRVMSHRHERVGEELTRHFLSRMTDERDLVEAVIPLVGAHLAPAMLYRDRASDAAVRRLARRVGRIDRLVRVARADMHGRPPLPADEFPAGQWLLERAQSLNVSDSGPAPVVRGRDLLELGLEPGPELGAILDVCFEAQIEGRFADLEGGLVVAREEIARRKQ